MRSGRPMRRLLQGDVGSGKTAVAGALIHTVAKNGFQSALMAPTEVLAAQHYKTFCRFFENDGLRVALLTGSTKAKTL
jgi:ATP-dependent DNA helicase RecG